MHESSSLGTMALLHWAVMYAPVETALDRLVLVALADHADPDGCNACPSKDTLAQITMHSGDPVRKSLKRLVARKLIRRQPGPATPKIRSIPERYRPTVYEVLIPFAELGMTNVRRLNELREVRMEWGDSINSAPLTEKNRPMPTPAPRTGRKTRSDKGKPNPKRSPKKPNTHPTSDDTPDETPDQGALSEPPQDQGALQEPPAEDENRGLSQSRQGAFRKPQPRSTDHAPQLLKNMSPADHDVLDSSAPDVDPSTLTGSAAEGAPPEGAVIDQGEPEGSPVGDGEDVDFWSPEDVSGALREDARVSGVGLKRMAARCDELAAHGLTTEEILLILGALPKSKPESAFMDATADPDVARRAATPGRDTPGHRQDVDRLCEYLADQIETVAGYNRPKITNDWRRAARLMLDNDHALGKKIDFDGTIRIIDWTMRHEFWGMRGNIRSMTKLRAQFERLAGDARVEHQQRTGALGGGQDRRSRSDLAARDGATMEMTIDQMMGSADANGYWQDREDAERAGDLELFLERFYGPRSTWSSRVTEDRLNEAMRRLAEAGYRVDLDDPTPSVQRYMDVLRSSMESTMQRQPEEQSPEVESGWTPPPGGLLI